MRNRTGAIALLTGFEPFDGDPVNASWEAVRALDGADIVGHRVVARCLPCTLSGASASLLSAMQDLNPAAVVAVGQAGGREKISLERVAINLVDARIPDNDGAQPIDVPVVVDGPDAYFSTLPLKPMLVALRDAGYPAEISHTAGTYVCNQVFYALRHALRDRPGVPAGFVHVPFIDTQAERHPGKPALPLGDVVASLRVLLQAVLDPPPVTANLSAGREA